MMFTEKYLCPQKNIHIAIQTSKHVKKIKTEFAAICPQPQKFPYIHREGGALKLFSE